MILFVLLFCFWTSSCRRGCTDKDATNYCACKREKKGSCTYRKGISFWFNQEFQDSCLANNIRLLQIFLDNEFIAEQPFPAGVSGAIPESPCQAFPLGITIHGDKELGHSKAKTCEMYVKVRDSTGNIVHQSAISNVFISIYGPYCGSYQLIY